MTLVSLEEDTSWIRTDTQRDDPVRTQRKITSTSQERGLGRNRPCPHLDLNFQPPELWENRFPGFTCPVCSICYGSLTRIIQALEVSPASLQVKETCWWMNTRQCPLVLCSGGKSAYNLLRIVAERVSEYIHELIHKLFPEFTKI